MRTDYTTRLVIDDLATITTFTPPQEIQSLDDIADFKILFKKLNGHVVVYYQIDMHIDPVIDKHESERVRKRLRHYIDVHANQPEFIAAYGRCSVAKGEPGAKPQELKLTSVMSRIVRYNGMASYIRSTRDIPGGCISDIRLPRGINFRCIPEQLTALIESHDRQPAGKMMLYNKPHVFFMWRPSVLNLNTLSAEVIKEAFIEEVNKTFPFVDMYGFEMQFNVAPGLVAPGNED